MLCVFWYMNWLRIVRQGESFLSEKFAMLINQSINRTWTWYRAHDKVELAPYSFGVPHSYDSVISTPQSSSSFRNKFENFLDLPQKIILNKSDCTAWIPRLIRTESFMFFRSANGTAWAWMICVVPGGTECAVWGGFSDGADAVGVNEAAGGARTDWYGAKGGGISGEWAIGSLTSCEPRNVWANQKLPSPTKNRSCKSKKASKNYWTGWHRRLWPAPDGPVRPRCPHPFFRLLLRRRVH